MGLIAPIATSVAPSLIKGGMQLAGGSKESMLEKKYTNLMDMLQGKLTKPLTERDDFKLGKTQLDQADRRNKEKATNAIGAGNYTNEAKLSVMDSTNQAYGAQLNQLMANVSQMKDMDQSRLMGVMQALANARSKRINDYNQKLGSILDPLGKAGSAWLETELNAPDDKKDKGGEE